MNYTTLISILAIFLDAKATETTNEPIQDTNMKPKDQKDIFKNRESSVRDWIYRQNNNESKENIREAGYHAVLRPPFSLTRLAKSLNYGYDPFFRKEHFEPFERRNKPVTLIVFRRNHILPRALVSETEVNSLEVAEMQSPYNTVSKYWEDTLQES